MLTVFSVGRQCAYNANIDIKSFNTLIIKKQTQLYSLYRLLTVWISFSLGNSTSLDVPETSVEDVHRFAS